MIRSIALAIVLFAAPQFAAERPEATAPPSTRTPVLVELFTSEGCSSCPSADRLLIELHRTQPIAGAQLLVLSEHVDYWNRLGWTDPFSDQRFSKRQSWYSMHWPTRVYTPQAIVDGTKELVGSDRKAMRKAIEVAVRKPKQPIEIRAGEIVDGRLRVAVDLPEQSGQRRADIYLALVEDDLVNDVSRGENSGLRLEHVGVVRSLEKLGATGQAESFDQALELEPGWDRSQLRLIAFAQDKRSRRIVALGSADLQQ